MAKSHTHGYEHKMKKELHSLQRKLRRTEVKLGKFLKKKSNKRSMTDASESKMVKREPEPNKRRYRAQAQAQAPAPAPAPESS